MKNRKLYNTNNLKHRHLERDLKILKMRVKTEDSNKRVRRSN